MQLITLDFETFYDKDYTLRKMSTSEYVRDGRFEAISVAIKLDDGPTEVYFGHETIWNELSRINWSQVILLAHHTHFDGLILTHHFGHKPAKYLDTLSMARATFPKTLKNDLDSVAVRYNKGNKLKMPDVKGRHLNEMTDQEIADMRLYNAADVDLCYEIYLEMVKDFPGNELALIDLTVRMFAEPVMRVDMRRAKAELKLEKANRRHILRGAGVPKADLMSSDRLADHLHAAGLDPPRKTSPKTKQLAWAFAKTDQEFTALVRHPNPVIANLVKARLVVKSTISETRAARIMNAGRHRKRVPVYLNYCGAHTTRWSGGDKLNFQNLPRGGELRKSLLAPPGHMIVVVDSRQIECRVLAWLAGEKWMLDEFAKPDGDPYCAFASIAYGRTITTADKDERFVGKTCVLGLGYSMAALKLQLQLGNKGVDLPLEVCEGLVNSYRAANQNIVDLWDILAQAIIDMSTECSGAYGPISWDNDRILLPNGLALHYPGVECTPYPARSRTGEFQVKVADGSYMTMKGSTKLYGGLLTENVIQALARVIVADQMLRIAERYRVVMMSHDEVAYVAPVKKAEEALQFGIDMLRTPPAWAPDLPLDAEGGFDRMYSK